MKLSASWIREWIDPGVPVEEIARRLTMAGLEVDSLSPVAEAFSGVVVARVESAERHPEADKLSLCQVSDGASTVQVVCGAPNVRTGLLVAFARVGAVLPGDFKIRKARLRGQDSFGMICSVAELGMGEDDGGILELPDALTPGTDLREALRLDDTAIDIELTPNRGDCLSVRGVARELGVLFDKAVNAPSMAAVPVVHDQSFPIQVQDAVACPRYLGRVIRGIDPTRQSPLWIQERLRRAGLRPIDATVDVTNYVMLELGQPLHAFDLAALSGGIDVRMARAGEPLKLLDGSDLKLDAQTLVIADGAGPVAIAGVMGGERSGVQDGTRDVFLECAFFAPLAVAGTARRYGLQTDASQRFERGVDPQLQHDAIERATALLLEIVGGEPGPVTEAVASRALPKPPEVNLRASRLAQISGLVLAPERVTNILQRLELELLDKGADGQDYRWRVRAPSHRFDIEREEDLIEEVCRIQGYDEIPVRVPTAQLALRQVPNAQVPPQQCRQRLVDLGYQEVVTYSFIDPAVQDLIYPGVAGPALSNPMSRDMSVMRTGLWPGLIKAIQGNVHRQQGRLRLFELARCFSPDGAQPWRLAGALYGLRLPENWTQPQEPVDFFDLKGDVENVLALSRQAVVFEPVADDPALHPGQAARVLLDGQAVGRLGRLHPELQQRLDLPAPVYLFDLDWALISRRTPPQGRDISRYPSVRRDLSLLVPQDVAAADVERVVRGAVGAALAEFRLFDVYHGEGIDSAAKSLAVGLTLQDPSRTLTEADINGWMNAAMEALRSELGVRMR